MCCWLGQNSNYWPIEKQTKKHLFLVEFLLPRFSLELGSLAVTSSLSTTGTALIFPLCVMQEGDKASKMSGCALQESITVSFCTGKLKLQMTRDYVQLKSVKSLLVWKAFVFFWSLYLCKLVEIPDHSSVEIIWWGRKNFHLTDFHRTNWKRLSLWGVVGEVGGSKRGRSLNVCEILWSSSLHALHIVIVI